MTDTKKLLGQHWLFDQDSLKAVVDAGEITKSDTVLEIGPGLGTLTKLLVPRAKQVTAVEKDEQLAADLSNSIKADNLRVVPGDILNFDLNQLSPDYKVVANLPYYLTSKLLRSLLESPNPPILMALLVQKEVGERITAGPGQMSLLALSVQYYAGPKLLRIVPKALFQPSPKVDAALIQIKRRSKPAFAAKTEQLFRLFKAGFSGKRKQLKNSLAAGLHLDPNQCSQILKNIGIDPAARAQELSLEDWEKVYLKIPID